nr:prepilin-type N-terminal cleavage/methylation domain-containing protein [Pseudomonadota bacterium]
MKRTHPGSTHPHGFTLVEVMIVIAIIGILASIAIPSFLRYGLRTKSAEVKSNLGAIRVVEEAIFSEYGNYLSAAAEPAAIPGATAVSFNEATPDYAALLYTHSSTSTYHFPTFTNDQGESKYYFSDFDIEGHDLKKQNQNYGGQYRSWVLKGFLSK